MSKARCTYVEKEMECHFTLGERYTCRVDHESNDPSAMIIEDHDGEEWYAEGGEGPHIELLGLDVKFEII